MSDKERVQKAALEVLSEHPRGIRASLLQAAVKLKLPDVPLNTIHANTWNLEVVVPDLVSKPARGLYILKEYEEATSSNSPVSREKTESRTKPSKPSFEQWMMRVRKNFRKELKKLKEQKKEQPALSLESAEAYYNRARTKHDKGDLEGAIADFDKAVEIDPQFAEAYYERGRSKHANWDYEDAIADYTRAIDINPEFNEAYYERGLARNLIFDDEGAMDDLAIVSLDAPKDDKAFLEYSFKATLESYDTYIECNPIEDIDRRDAKACRDLAKVYRRRGLQRTLVWNDSDIDDYDMAIEIDPGYAEAYLSRGMAKCNYKDYHSAIEDYTKAIEINPRFAEAYFDRGVSKMVVGDPNGATADRAKATEIDPRYARPYYDKLFGTATEAVHNGAEDYSEY